jgi:hypothetical protein
MLQRTEPPTETDTSIIKSTKSVGGDALTKSGDTNSQYLHLRFTSIVLFFTSLNYELSLLAIE